MITWGGQQTTNRQARWITLAFLLVVLFANKAFSQSADSTEVHHGRMAELTTTFADGSSSRTVCSETPSVLGSADKMTCSTLDLPAASANLAPGVKLLTTPPKAFCKSVHLKGVPCADEYQKSGAEWFKKNMEGK